MGDVGKGPPWMKAGVPSSVCTRLGLMASLSRAAMAPSALKIVGGYGGAGAAVGHHHPASRAFRSVRLSARQRTAMISEATVMSKPSSREHR